jgi:hypothetical protein
MPHFARVGEDVGANDGEAEGMALGDALGDEVGWGVTVGLAVGTFVGLTETLGEELGAEEGELEILGAADGTLVCTGGFVGSTGAVLPPPKTGERPSSNGGRVMSTLVGSAVSMPVSTIVGVSELVSLGCIEIDGNVEGAMETDGIGETDGRDDGMELIVGLGLMVGSAGISPEDGAILCASSCASCCNISSMAAISSSSCSIVSRSAASCSLNVSAFPSINAANWSPAFSPYVNLVA